MSNPVRRRPMPWFVLPLVGAITLLFAIVLGLLFWQVFKAAAESAKAAAGTSRPLSPADAAVLLTLNDLRPDARGAPQLVISKRLTIQGKRLQYVEYDETAPDGVSVHAKVGLMPSETIGHQHFDLIERENQMLLRFGKNKPNEQHDITLDAGDERSLTLFGPAEHPTGFTFCVRQGSRLMAIRATGFSFDNPQRIQDLITSRLGALALYEPPE